MVLMTHYVPRFTRRPTQVRSILQIFLSPVLQSIAPRRNACFQTRSKLNALGMSKAKVLCVFALQTSWAMWEENECHLLWLINKEHADVQLGRICFGGSNMLTLLNQADNGKFIRRQITENRIWKWEGKSLGSNRLRISCTVDQAGRNGAARLNYQMWFFFYVWLSTGKNCKYHTLTDLKSYQMLQTKLWQLSSKWLNCKTSMLLHIFRHLQTCCKKFRNALFEQLDE